MKLYRLSVIVHDTITERSVWADHVTFGDTHIQFFKKGERGNELVSSFPTRLTFITNIETKDEYDARKAK